MKVPPNMSSLAENLNLAIDSLGGAIAQAIDTLKQQADIEQSIAKLNALTVTLKAVLPPLAVTAIPPSGEAPSTTIVMTDAKAPVAAAEGALAQAQDEAAQPIVVYVDLSKPADAPPDDTDDVIPPTLDMYRPEPSHA